MSGYRLEGHKLHLHPDRVFEWYSGQNVAPIYVEVGPTSVCNHRCKMCAYDYMDHQAQSIDSHRLVSLMEELGDIGVRSVCFAGDGEPLLNKGTVDAICRAKECGVDTSLSTNGVLCSEDVLKKILPALTWIRFSVNAGTEDDYSAVHGTDKKDFEIVMQALKTATAIKKEMQLDVTLGVQFVLLPENASSVFDAANKAKQSGVDYFVVKPFYQNEENDYNVPDFSMMNYESELKRVESLSDDSFQSSVRWETEESNVAERRYDECYGLSFITVIAANGDVYPCLPHQEKEKRYGNINKSTFSDIWNSESRQVALKRMKTLDKNKCQPNCRHHWINEYLWDINNPAAHRNFI